MTRTDIANLALGQLGANLIANIDSQALIDLQLTQALAQILRTHDWNFAQQVAALAVLADPGGTPADLTFAFTLPGNYVRRTAIHSDGVPLEAIEYKILGGKLFACHDLVTLTYVHSDPATTLMPPDFIQALSTLLASKLAGTLLKNAAMVRELYSTYIQTELPEAKRNDVQESPGSLYVHERAPYATSPAIASRRTRSTPGAYGIDAPAE